MKQTVTHYRKKKKRVLPILIACLLAVAIAVGLVLYVLSHHFSQSGGNPDTPPATQSTAARPTLPKSFIDKNTFSSHVVLYDTTDKRVLYTKDPDTKCYPASLTKLMTAIVAIENTPADTVFKVGDEVHMIDPESSRAYLTVGTRLELKHLLQAMLLPSGNDAAYVLAVHVGRIIAGDNHLDNRAAIRVFCDKMNETAKNLGCTGTHFANPDGIHQNDHYTTANDMLKIAQAGLEHPLLAEIVKMPEVNARLLSGQSVHWKNSNRLLHKDDSYYYENATGLKTGSTEEAGFCLAASAHKDGHTSIVILMGSKSESGRWDDARGLLDISFQ